MLCIKLACFHRDASRSVVTAARECNDLSEEAASLCSTAQSKGESMVSLSRDIQGDLQAFGSGSGGGSSIDASIFVKIKDLIENKKTTEAVTFTEELDGMASQILGKAEEMSKALNRGISSLPDDVKEEYGGENEETNYRTMDNAATGGGASRDVGDANEREIEKLLDVDKDVAELENSVSRSRGGLNIFSAGTMGSAVFEQTTSKGLLCQNLFTQMRDLCGSVARLAKALVTDNCCDQARAIAAGVSSLFRCHHLVKLLAKAAQAAMRLIKAIGSLIRAAWQRFQGFLEEFFAAKKLGKFVSGVKNSKVGQMAAGLVSTLLPGKASAGMSRS